MVDEIKKQIKELYNERVLTPYLGEGKLKQKLLSGLEEILDGIEIPSKTILNKSSLDFNLDDKIDYFSMYRIAKERGIGYGRNVRVIKSGLENAKIETYRDLIEYTKDKIQKRHGDIRKRNDGIRDPFNSRGFGSIALSILYNHLNCKNIRLFDDKYTPWEILAYRANIRIDEKSLDVLAKEHNVGKHTPGKMISILASNNIKTYDDLFKYIKKNESLGRIGGFGNTKFELLEKHLNSLGFDLNAI